MKKSSKEWLDEIQSKIHLEIDVNNKQCGWDSNNFNHTFHCEQITLDEFKERVKKSIIECNVLEINNWLNDGSTFGEKRTINP